MVKARGEKRIFSDETKKRTHLDRAIHSSRGQLEYAIQRNGHVRRLRTRQTHVEGVDDTENTLQMHIQI